MRARPRFELILAAVLLGGFAARAEEIVYGPDGAPTVVQRKLYTMTGRWEVSALFDVALNTALVNQLGGVLAVSYHPNEWLDFGVEGLFNYTALSNLAVNVRNDLRSRTASPNHCTAPKYPGCMDEFANDSQLRAGGFGVVRLAPIYGKFNLASEVSVHFQAFALGGAGVASVHRESVNLCAHDSTRADCKVLDPQGNVIASGFQQTDAVKPVGLVGGGFRFYFGQRWSLTAEVRGTFFLSSYKEHNELTNAASGSPISYLAGITTLDTGLSFLF
jgi:outer membrane beta-barrel protein